MASALTLFHCTRSRSMRCLWTLYELDLPFQLVTLPFPPRLHQRDYVKQVNPLGTVPCLIDGDAKLTESVGICEYLAERHGPPGCPLVVRSAADGAAARARYLDYLYMSDSQLTTPLTLIFRYATLEPEARRCPQVVRDATELFHERLRPLDQLLRSREYIAADRFTLADLCVAYALVFAQSLGIDADFTPNVSRFYRTVSDRPAFQRALHT